MKMANSHMYLCTCKTQYVRFILDFLFFKEPTHKILCPMQTERPTENHHFQIQIYDRMQGGGGRGGKRTKYEYII